LKWGAHKADMRIAAKNAPKIRASLRSSINAKEIFEDYQKTQPLVSDNNTQDRARARAWAMMNVKVNKEPIVAALIKTWADGYALGQVAAEEAILRLQRAQRRKLAYTEKASDYVDWSKWQPGNLAASLLLRPTDAFRRLLAQAGITSETIAKAGYDRIGTALADSLAAGFSPNKAAKVIAEKIGDPARALVIAVTEQNRAMSIATLASYKEAELEEVEWMTSDPCDECEINDGQVVRVGQPFVSGDTEPPVHPNCRCALLPVISGVEDDPSGGQDFLDTLNGGDLSDLNMYD
jgi:SPP1 gp7 family putative phage head morphogenesis protein